MNSLQLRNPIEREGEILFVARNHTYKRSCKDKSESCLSVTDIVKKQFPEFDGNLVVETHYASWKANPSSKYQTTIQHT